MPRFAFLLNHAPDRYEGLSDDEAMVIFKDYMQWMEQAIRDGVCEGGHKLTTSGGKTLRATDDGVEVHDSPLAELTEVLGGFMIVKAGDPAAAVELARTHPHLVHNRTLEIRQLEGE